MIKVDKNVPIANPIRGSGGYKYPFRTLEVGDSFSADKKVYQALNMHMKRFKDRTYQVRKVDDGYRCWRIV